MKLNMDGSNATAFVNTDMISPRGLAIDANGECGCGGGVCVSYCRKKWKLVSITLSKNV